MILSGSGDRFIRETYMAIRTSPLWNKYHIVKTIVNMRINNIGENEELDPTTYHYYRTLFVITYDEHGGFFDHVPPPADCPSPDGTNHDQSRKTEHKDIDIV